MKTKIAKGYNAISNKLLHGHLSLSTQFDISSNREILKEGQEKRTIELHNNSSNIINFNIAKHIEVSIIYYHMYCITIIYKPEQIIAMN